MKYTIETTKNGVSTYLQTADGVFTMRYKKRDGCDGIIESSDKDFVEQIEEIRGDDEEYLDALYDMLSEVDMFPMGFLSFAEEWEVEK